MLWGQGLFSHLCVSGASFLHSPGPGTSRAQLLFDGQDGAGGGRGRDGQRECQCLKILGSLVPFAFL